MLKALEFIKVLHRHCNQGIPAKSLIR